MKSEESEVRFNHYRKITMVDKFGILKIPKPVNDISSELTNFINNIFSDDQQQVCCSRISDLLYNYLINNSKNQKVYNEILDIKRNIVIEQSKKMNNVINNDVFKLLEYWIRYKKIIKEISKIFGYINMKTHNLFNIHSYKFDYQYFLGEIVHSTNHVLCGKLVDLILDGYHGKHFDRLISLVKVYTKYSFEGSTIRKYKEIFINLLIKKIEEKIMFNQLMGSIDNPNQFIINVTNIFTNIHDIMNTLEEYLEVNLLKTVKLQLLGKFVKSFLHNLTFSNVDDTFLVIQQIIDNHLAIIKVVHFMLLDDNKKGTECENNKRNKFIDIFSLYVKKSLNVDITDKKIFSNQKLYNHIINTYDRYQKLVNIFTNDTGEKFVDNTDLYFIELLNKDELVIKYLCVSIHENIKDLHNTSDNNIDEFIKNCKIITYITNKDIFTMTYAKYLQDRLLNDSNQLVNYETELKLIKTIGILFSVVNIDMEKMVDEAKISRINTNEFRKLAILFGENSAFMNVPYDLSKVDITVISNNIWKLIDRKNRNNYSCLIPKELLIYHVIYKNFFNKKCENCPDKVLDWMHDLSQVVLNIQFENKSYVFKTTASQAFVLMLFDTKDEYTYDELVSKLEMPNNILDNILTSLEIVGVLKHTDDMFQFNKYFHNKRSHINLLKYLTVKQQEQVVKETVMFDRQDILKANILRIVKTSEKINTNNLFELVKQKISTRFELETELYDKILNILISDEFVKKEDDYILYC